jgi:hypothetical protein
MSQAVSVCQFPSTHPSAVFSLTAIYSNFTLSQSVVELQFGNNSDTDCGLGSVIWSLFRYDAMLSVCSSLRTIIESLFEQAMLHEEPGRLWSIAFRYCEQIRLSFSHILLFQQINGQKEKKLEDRSYHAGSSSSGNTDSSSSTLSEASFSP